MSVRGGTSATDLRSRVPGSRSHAFNLKYPTSLPIGVAPKPKRNRPIPTNTCSRRPLAFSSSSSSPPQSSPKMHLGGRQQQRLAGPQAVPALDLFPDGALVRLLNRAQETYLHADEDGDGVSLRPHGPDFSVNKVWRVHRVDEDGAAFVLLQGVAYGRYLALSPGATTLGCLGNNVVQRDYNGPGPDAANLMWRPFRMVEGDDRYVRLRLEYNRNLRANGRFRFWYSAATVSTNEDEWTTMMEWSVRRFQLAPGPPPLPLPTAMLGARSGLFGLFRRLIPEADGRRGIRHVRANDQGDFDQNYDEWARFHFYGRSVFNLRTQVGSRQPGGEVGDSIILAVKPGLQGRLTPLVTDLPRSADPMTIVVFNAGSQGAQNFVYPDIP